MQGQEVAERLRAMRARESCYVCPDYLADGWQEGLKSNSRSRGGAGSSPGHHCEDDLVVPLSPTNSSTDVSAPNGYPGGSHDDPSAGLASFSPGRIGEAWRERVCRWYYQVVDGYDFDREVVSVAASCLDRYLALRPLDGRGFRLVGMTALYLAIKLHSSDRKLRLSCFVHMGRAFSREQFEETERDVLEALEWRVHPVTPQAVLRELLGLLPSAGDGGEARLEIEETALFLTELSVCDYWFASKKPSSVALAAVLLAVDLLPPGTTDPPTAHPRRGVAFLERAVGVGLGDIIYSQEVGDCYRRLRGMYSIAA